MPISSKDQPNLPTHRQYIKDNPPEHTSQSWLVERVLWNDSWRTVTFVTNCFRYSVKCATSETYRATTDMLMENYSPEGYVYTKVFYDREEQEWLLYWEKIEEYPDAPVSKVTKFDWGFIVEPSKRPEKKNPPASKKKSASAQ